MDRCSWLKTVWVLALGSTLAGCAATAPDYAAILINPDRPPNERELDGARKPNEVLAFYGVKSGDRVADIYAGRGYYTAILSELVGMQGLVYSAIPASRSEITERWKKPSFANVRVLDGPMDKIALPQDGSLDFVIIHLNYHVVDHSAKDGTGNAAAKTLHRIDKQLVIKEVTGSGFTLAKEGNMLRKPEDPRDFNVNKVRNKDDRFVLAFVKP
ncbi:MAG: class I SAM-dependent methyltransferase [Deltaproteobacteria bacterium]|nr:class I SAM-dependent methyltransferase [Deltaproteobacteria bacterium]